MSERLASSTAAPAIRADPRYVQLRAHIWHELKAARPARTAA